MVWGLEKYRQAHRNNHSEGHPAILGFFRDSVLKSCCLPTLSCESISHRSPSTSPDSAGI